MERDRIIQAALDALLYVVFATLLTPVSNMLSNPSSFYLGSLGSLGGVIGLFSLGVALCLTIYLIFTAFKRGQPSLGFTRLSFHSVKKKGKKTWIVYSPTGQPKQAYWFPNYLESSKRKINNCPHDNENALNSYFKSQEIHKNPEHPTLKKLGLVNFAYDCYTLRFDEALLSQLRQLKLEKYMVAFVYPWWTLGIRFLEKKAFPPSNVVLADLISREAFEAPNYPDLLAANKVIRAEFATKLPFQKLTPCLKRRLKINYDKGYCQDNAIKELNRILCPENIR